MNRIFYIMGKSASGKDRLYRNLLAYFSGNEPCLKPLISCTTRSKRSGEEDGKDYFFTAPAAYLKDREEGRIIEERVYETVYGPWIYYTSAEHIDLAAGSYLGIGTLESFRSLSAYFGPERVVPVYIEVEDGIRLFRALKRERAEEKPGYEELCRRFLSDAEDFSREKLEEAGIQRIFENNGAFEDCLDEIISFIREFKDA
ncbi:MAG: guanylate kinase [Lachnospiraceae bacterium]|nr:guanylate kinase [Lachnospiraceae bacterium]